MALTVDRDPDPAVIDSINTDDLWEWSVASWRRIDAGFETSPSTWLLAEVDGEPAGFAAGVPIGVAAGGCGMAMIWVRPEHRRLGVATALRAEIEAVVRGVGLPGVQYAHDTDDQDALAAVAAWGLPETARHQESALDLDHVDTAAFEERAARPGVDLTLLPDLTTYDEQAWERLHSFVADRWADAPDSTGSEPLPPEVLRAELTEGWLAAVASVDGEWVGFTAVSLRPGRPDEANTFLTGVTPEARGRGIASALKCFHALALREHGVRRVVTQNMHGNEPILAANRTLGFRPHREYADVVVTFGS